MRHLKTLTLAAMAVFALVAFAGAGTASATMLCTVGTDPCPAANTIASGTTINGALPSGGTAVLTTSGGIINPTITCTASTTMLTTTSAGGGAGVNVTGNLDDVSFSSCMSSGASCNTSATVANGRVTGLPTSGSLSWTSGFNGSLTLTAPVVHFSCTVPLFGTSECYFGGNSITGTVTGGNPAQITFNNVTIGIVPPSNNLCPTQAHWTATYAAQAPMSSIFVTNS